MSAESLARTHDRLLIRVQVPLRSHQRPVPRDLPQHMHRHSCIGHPGQTRVTQIVPTQVLISKLGHNLVPVRRISQHCRSDRPAAGASEQPGHRIIGDLVKPPQHDGSDLRDDRHQSRTISPWCPCPSDRQEMALSAAGRSTAISAHPRPRAGLLTFRRCGQLYRR
jgi:hypothetical protein